MTPLDVEIIFTPACPHGRTLRGRIHALARGEGIEVAVTETILADPAAAEARRFRGSPTVLVQGSDIEPQPAAAPADYGLG
jgi:hypothetical protein